jgi:hydroxymethylbilane synthase
VASRPLRIGTRGSPMALYQAELVRDRLRAAHPDLAEAEAIELVPIRTTGDRVQTRLLAEIGGKGLFTKEIEEALLDRRIDLAVHSLKDMETVLPPGLAIGCVLPRDDPRDAVVLRDGIRTQDFAGALAHLGEGPSIGTSSIRRIAQLAPLVHRARFAPMRGNVDTRLRKLDAGGYDALILAAAGMRRLGLGARISAAIPIEACVPAPGQGIVAIEIRTGDERTRRLIAPASDSAAAAALTAERAVVMALGGGCQLPLGAIALHDRAMLRMHGVVATPDGVRAIRCEAVGPAGDPAAVGAQLADALARAGAMEILDRLRVGD